MRTATAGPPNRQKALEGQAACRKGREYMIRYIKGILTEADDQGIVLENNGIGFYIFVPAAMFCGKSSHGRGDPDLYLSECEGR